MKDLRDPRPPLFDARSALRAGLRPLEPEPNPMTSGAELTLDDIDMLLLLEHVVLDFAADEAESRDRYVAATAGITGVPSFDDLHQDGWFQILFGRIVTPTDISVAASHATSASPGLPVLISQRFGLKCDFSAVPSGTRTVDDAIEGLETNTLRFIDIGCRTPAWVAARLWERRPSSGDALRWWLDRWYLLGRPLFSPLEAWGGGEARDFVDLVLDRLESEPSLIDWSDIPQAVANYFARMAGKTGPGSLARVPPVPGTVVARARWIDSPGLGDVASMRTDAFSDVRHLVDLIVGDIEDRRHSAVPDRQFARLSEIALQRPDLMQMLMQRALLHPLMVAEFLMEPATCALGCWLLTRPSLGQLSLPDRSEAAHRSIQALQQALTLIQRFMDDETAIGVPAEVAALLEGAYDTVGRPRRYGQVDEAEKAVLGALQLLGPDAAPIVDAIASGAISASLDAPAFVAALDLVAAAGLENVVKPYPLPEHYIRLVQAGHDQLSANRVSPARAAALFRLAKRGGAPFFAKALHPFDWNRALAALKGDQFERRQKIVRSIEAATRYLASAISGLADETPSAMVDALAAHVVAGSEDDWANGKVWAFANANLNLPWAREQPKTVGSLLGEALSALAEPEKERLLTACLVLREPAVLADVYRAAPRDCQARIATRIDEIGTDKAIPSSSLQTENLRIDSLLDAGLTEAAERHMQAARKRTTLGTLHERPRIEFNHDMRLLFQKGDWSSIKAATIPAGLPRMESEVCQRILESFQAIAFLQDVNADSSAAVARLERLTRNNPAELGHQINLFAARVSAALGPVNFPVLSGANKRGARQLIAEVETWMATTSGITSKDRDICVSNLAPLDLAIGDYRRALGRLQSLPTATENPPRMAYTAIALARLDRTADAHDVLDRAMELFGNDALLAAARAHLVGDKSAGGLGASDRLIFTPAPEDVRRLKDAMAQFQRAPALDKAAILHNGADPLSALIADYVDNALAGVANLAPLLKRGVLRDGEDDITALLKQMLNGSLRFLGFSTPDQCKGGYTPNENYGERDLILVDGNTEIAVLEAVIADGNVPKNDLVKHFRKMLGYGDCSLYVYLTYAWLDDMTRLIDALKSIAKEEAPSGHAFEGLEERPRVGNAPAGFTARYRVGGQAIQVVFRVLDLGQERLRNAAASSARAVNVPTRKRKKTLP